jgi:hypothetical protein
VNKAFFFELFGQTSENDNTWFCFEEYLEDFSSVHCQLVASVLVAKISTPTDERHHLDILHPTPGHSVMFKHSLCHSFTQLLLKLDRTNALLQ